MGLTVGELGCAPAFVQQPVVRLAGERQLVDVRQPAAGPFVDMMDLADVARCIASGKSTAAVVGVEHKTLVLLPPRRARRRQQPPLTHRQRW